MNPTIISVMNQKGGTGKTTTSINLSACMVQQGKRVLLVGMDLQGDLAYSLGIDHGVRSITEVLIGDISIADVIVPREGVDVIPADITLADVELNIIGQPDSEYILKEKLKEISGKYDFIIIDCSPSLSLLTINALCASNQILIPIQLTVLSTNGLELVIDTIDRITKNLAPDIEIMGVLPVMVDFRKKLSEEILNYLKESYDLKIFDPGISINVRAAESPSFGKSILAYAPKSKSARDYMRVTKEILKQNQNGIRKKFETEAAHS